MLYLLFGAIFKCRRGENEWGLQAVLLVSNLLGETDTIHANAAFES